jgi:hypothetical protein
MKRGGEAAVVKSQAMEGRSGLANGEELAAPNQLPKRRSGMIAIK